MDMPSLQDLPAPPQELVSYIADHPEIPMVEIMKPYRQYEAGLRTVFAQDRSNPALEDPHLGLLPLFTDKTNLITTRARNLEAESPEEKSRYIMELPDEKRRPHGSPAVAQSIKEFQKNFGIFSESSLADLNWDNVVAAGSSVINCLLPVPAEFNTTKRKLREYYHEKLCPASDVDLFLYGLTHEEAIEKIKEIEQSIRDAILSEVTVVRTKYAITIASQYPTRHVQIVLRVYKSIGEILTGFDIDAAGGAYDGKQVYVAPRALGSFITQINHIDLTRRSPSYENRLSKYSRRYFEVYWPELDRSRVDPTIFERSFQRTLGLARLLVLERLPTTSSREAYMTRRREERGRPASNYQSFRHLSGNIKDHHEDEVADWVNEAEVSNYHTFTIPYGPNFHAKKIEKLCYTKDLLLNAEWNQPKDREVYTHRHPAFFGRVQDVIEDCCGMCPVPKTVEEKEAAEKEREIYISGKVTFLIDNPGRQQIGSFNPLTDDDWTDMAYIGNTARLCQSIVDMDLDDVQNWLSQEGSDPNQRDYTGRTPLHLAVISSTAEIVRALVDHGARITARVADGRTALHLAAQRGDTEMVKILMEKSTANEEEAEERLTKLRLEKFGDKKNDEAESVKDDDSDRMDVDNDSNSDSDGELVDEATDVDMASVATGSFVKVKKDEDETKKDEVPEDSPDEPDFYKVDVLAWDIPSSPLHLAISGGHEEVVSLLCEFGSDALLPVKFLNSDKEPVDALLTLALALRLPLDQAKSMAKLLLKLGASSAQADLHGCTALHRYVQEGSEENLQVLWEHDKTGVTAALNHLMQNQYWNPDVVSPLHTAILKKDPILVLRLLEAGANPQIDFEKWLQAAKFSERLSGRLSDFESNQKMYHEMVEQPLITALQKCPDPEVAYELVQKGADPNVITKQGYQILTNDWSRHHYEGETALDLVQKQLKQLRKYKVVKREVKKPELPEGIDSYLEQFQEGTWQHWIVSDDINSRKQSHEHALKTFAKPTKELESKKENADLKQEAISELIQQVEKLEKALLDKGAKSFYELHPDIDRPGENRYRSYSHESKKKPYEYKFTIGNTKDVTDIRQQAYIQLFEAAWAGDLDKIKSFTLQSWGEEQSEPPLKIAVHANESTNPFSLAFLRGHKETARAILDIAAVQYTPAEKEDVRFRLRNRGSDDEDGSDDYDSDEESEASDAGPQIVASKVNQKFTIDNIGQVSMQVQSHTKPIEMLEWHPRVFKMENGKVSNQQMGSKRLFLHVLEENDLEGLKFLLELAMECTAKKLDDADEEPSGLYSFPLGDFEWALKNSKTYMVAEIIRCTGAGLPLDKLIKRSGVEVKEKPRYYQGLTVYGKKRKDWANAGRNLVTRQSGEASPLLLQAIRNVKMEIIEWLLSDAPLRKYLEFGKSKAARTSPKLKHLTQYPERFERVVAKWLGTENELAIHCAVMNPPTKEAVELLKYLLQVCPGDLETKNTIGNTPLMTACRLGRTEYVKMLIRAGADQSVRNKFGHTILHMTLQGAPTVAQLQPMLDLFDKDLTDHLFVSRANLHDDGTTPLHAFISGLASSYKYKVPGHGLEVLELLLKRSKGAGLEMLNGAGDTCLHSVIMKKNELVVRALLDFRPSLLYRENAVGRTPAEVAMDHVTHELFRTPQRIELYGSGTFADILRRDASEFKKEEDTAAAGKKRPSESAQKGVWRICHEVMQAHPAKRRLVSLHEANDVARRLGESYSDSRYFTAKSKDDEEEEERIKDDEEEENKNKADFSERAMQSSSSMEWLCEKCHQKHDVEGYHFDAGKGRCVQKESEDNEYW